MKKKISQLLMIFGTAIFITGCQANKDKSDQKQNDTISENMTVGNVAADGTYTGKEVTIKIPEEWTDKYVILEGQDGFSCYLKSSYEKDKTTGLLFEINKSKKPMFDMPGDTQLAYTKNAIYVLTQPTDVSCVLDDENIIKEYSQLSSSIEDIICSVTIDQKDVTFVKNEYVMPMSEYYKYEESDLESLNSNQLWLGKNEIYARHGKTFDNGYLQMYFDQCFWYQATKQDQFEESILNEVEKANIKTIEAMEKKYAKEHPYPMTMKVGETSEIDLNMDGQKELIGYKVKGDYDNFKCELQIDDMIFDLSQYDAYMVSPEKDKFFITNISKFDMDGEDKYLEIAILDYGPSNDPITYFFRYDNDLKYIGSVSGFPFRDMDVMDGMYDDGIVYGVDRCDLINTVTGYMLYRYDDETREMKPMEDAYYTMLPDMLHTLQIDLPVYRELSKDSKKLTMKKGEKVKFLSTDGESWIRIKSEHGYTGYIYITEERKIEGLDMEGSEVFSDMYWYD